MKNYKCVLGINSWAWILPIKPDLVYDGYHFSKRKLPSGLDINPDDTSIQDEKKPPNYTELRQEL